MRITKIPVISAVFCFLSIAFGAFGAHSFKPFLLANNHLETFETASKYLMYGGILSLIQYIFYLLKTEKKILLAARIMLISTSIFSGALYLICLSGIKTFGAIAPLGGLGMMASLLIFAYSFRKINAA